MAWTRCSQWESSRPEIKAAAAIAKGTPQAAYPRNTIGGWISIAGCWSKGLSPSPFAPGTNEGAIGSAAKIMMASRNAR